MPQICEITPEIVAERARSAEEGERVFGEVIRACPQVAIDAGWRWYNALPEADRRGPKAGAILAALTKRGSAQTAGGGTILI